MGEGLGKTFTALSSGLACSFWLISCWCHPRIYVTRKGLGKIFTALRYSFLFLRASRKVYNTLLKTSKAGNLSTPFDVCISFLCHCHFNKISTTQSYEWLRLSLVPELNLLLRRLQIQWSTVKKVKLLSRVQLFAAPWTVAYQAPLSMGFSRQEYWNRFPFPSPGESSLPRDRTLVSRITGRRFNLWATREHCKLSFIILGAHPGSQDKVQAIILGAKW